MAELDNSVKDDRICAQAWRGLHKSASPTLLPSENAVRLKC